MNIIDVCLIKYPGMIDAGKIVFAQHSASNIELKYWDVPNVSQPTIEELEAEIPQYQRQFDVNAFNLIISFKVNQLLDATAKSKGYDSSSSLIGYTSSSNVTWKAEADVFANWRDSIWEAVFIEYSAIDAGADIPNEDVFMATLPQIEWPFL